MFIFMYLHTDKLYKYAIAVAHTERANCYIDDRKRVF